MKKKEFPETIEETQSLMDDLTFMAENESDRERRRELFLLKLELKDHIIKLGLRSKRKRRSLKKSKK